MHVPDGITLSNPVWGLEVAFSGGSDGPGVAAVVGWQNSD